MTFTEVLDRYPTLCAVGFGISNFPTYRRDPPGARAQLQENRAYLERERPAIETALAFLGACDPTVTPRLSSYALKHWAENWGARSTGVSYVSNGALIAAALMADLVVQPCEPASVTLKALGQVGPNAWIGVSQRSVQVAIRRTR
jgi:hypothetical protein